MEKFLYGKSVKILAGKRVIQGTAGTSTLYKDRTLRGQSRRDRTQACDDADRTRQVKLPKLNGQTDLM